MSTSFPLIGKVVTGKCLSTKLKKIKVCKFSIYILTANYCKLLLFGYYMAPDAHALKAWSVSIGTIETDWMDYQGTDFSNRVLH